MRPSSSGSEAGGLFDGVLARGDVDVSDAAWLRALLDNNITVHGQIVVCPGVNDGAILDNTLAGVLDQYPELASIACVPLGLSKFNAESAMRPHTVAEAADWHGVVEGPIEATPAAEDRAFLATAAEIATAIDWSADPWHALTAALKERTGRKGKPLFLPLRRALTGRDSGPDMAALLPLIGRTRAVDRLGQRLGLA